MTVGVTAITIFPAASWEVVVQTASAKTFWLLRLTNGAAVISGFGIAAPETNRGKAADSANKENLIATVKRI
jgi:hypothetical protein